MTGTAIVISSALEVVKLAINAIELAQAGDLEAARRQLFAVQNRVRSAEQAWKDATDGS